MGWRFYAQRPGTGLWLDTNVQLGDPELTWQLSGPSSGKALIPAGLNNSTLAEDGENVWGKGNTILYGEEDGNLSWCGWCTAADPDEKGLHLEFVGTTGWLQAIPYNAIMRTWKINVFDVVRNLIAHSKKYEPGFDLITHGRDSAWSVGDPQPPNKPRKPHRRKGESVKEYRESNRYEAWEKDVEAWDKKYGDREKFEIAWYEAPYVGEELDSLAKEIGFDYRERVKWLDKGKLTPAFHLDFEDNMVRRRDDIQFVDGVNLVQALDPKDTNDEYANRVIALGAGEGRAMARVAVGGDDGRLYQAKFVQYKTVKNLTRLRALAKADHDRVSSTDPTIGSVAVRDIPGFASISSLRVGDEVEVISQNTEPNIQAWVRVTAITRNPYDTFAVVAVEAAA